MEVPPGPLSQENAAKISALLKEHQLSLSDYQSNFYGDNAPDVRGGSYTDNIVPNIAFPVKLTAVSGGLYSWTEQIAGAPDYAGWSDLPGGRSGTDTLNPAYEPNDATIDTSGNPVVWIGRAYYDPSTASGLDWVYVIVGTTGAGGSSSLTVKDSDSSDICPNITTILIDVNSMDAICGDPGEVTLYALGTNSIYVLYQDHSLKAVPCIAGVPSSPPYSAPIIAQMSTLPGLDMTSSLHTLGTNPTSDGGSGTATNCIPAMPPPTGYYCHNNPGGNTCNTSPYPAMGDTSVTGPYPDSATCTAVCAGGPPPPPPANQMYSETPGINWLVNQGTSAGDTGPCTVKLTASVTYPPPNQNQLVNGYIPGQGSLYRLNLVDACTTTWLVHVNDDCATIDLTCNWNGLTVYGGTDCPYPNCSEPEDVIAQAATLVFSRCDFKTTDAGNSLCPPLKAVKVQTCGLTTTLTFAYLKSDCTTGTISLAFKDGLLRDSSIS